MRYQRLNPPIFLVAYCRICKASAELISPDASTSAAFKIMDGISTAKAAEECGFSTYSAFYKAYVKHYGVSPTAGVFPFDTL